MTRFNAKGISRSATEWSEEAFKTTAENGNQWKIIIGIVAAVFSAGATTPLVGCIVLFYTITHCWKQAGAIQRAQKAIIETGCVANVLEGDHFHDYVAQVGHDAVMEELRYAESRELLISNDALDYLEEHENETLSTAMKGRDESPLLGGGNTIKEVHGGTATLVKDAPKIDVYQPQEEAQVNIIEQMSNRITNTYVIGTPGSGKGILIDNARREAQAKDPELRVFLIDPKADPKESGYHQGIDVVKAYPCVDAKPATVAAWAEAAFDEYVLFAQRYQKTLLIVDEGTMLASKLKEAKSNILKDKLTSWMSGGDSFGRNTWFMAVSPYVDGGINLATMSQMTKIVIAFGENLGSLLDWKKSGLFAKVSIDTITELIELSPVNRAIFWGKTAKWHAMPRLDNHTGYDRDRREYIDISGMKTVIQPAPEIEEETEPIKEEERTEVNQIEAKIIEIIKASDKGIITLEAIRKSRRWGDDTPSLEEMREGLGSLIVKGKIEELESGQYRIL